MPQEPAHTPVGVFVGLSVLDLVNRVEHYPGPNEKVTANTQELAAGGPAANAAVTFAGLGGRAILITALGSSLQASIALQDLNTWGVEVIDCAGPEFHLATSCITVVEASGDRAIVSLDAGNVPVTVPPSLEDLVESAVQGCDVVLFDGHHPAVAANILEVLSTQPESTRPLTVLDAGRYKPQFEWLLPRVDHVVASADFADPKAYVPHSAGAGNDVGSANQVIVRTRGGQPALYWAAGVHGEVAPQQTQVLDTSGAGDAFHGGYAFSVATQLRDQNTSVAVEWAIAFAHQVAGHRVAHVGPRSWVKTLSSAVQPDHSSK